MRVICFLTLTFPVYCLATSNIDVIYNQKQDITSNIAFVNNNKKIQFTFCDKGNNLVIIDKNRKSIIKLDSQCYLIIKQGSRIWTFHKKYVNQWGFQNEELILEHKQQEFHKKLYDYISSIKELHSINKHESKLYIVENNKNQYFYIMYDLITKKLTKNKIDIFQKSNPVFLGATFNGKQVKQCFANIQERSSCVTLPLNDKVMKIDPENKIKKLNNSFLLVSNSNRFFVSPYFNKLRFCFISNGNDIHCLKDESNRVPDYDKYVGSAYINRDFLNAVSGFYHKENESFIVRETKINVNNDNVPQHSIVVSENKTALSAFKKGYFNKYPNMRLLNFNSKDTFKEVANDQIDKALENNSILLIEGKSSFVNTLKPKSVTLWKGGDLVLLVKESSNIYHIRTMNYNKEKIKSNSIDYFNKVASNTDKTLEKLLGNIKHRSK